MGPITGFFSQFAGVWAVISHTWWLWVPPLIGRQLWQFWKLYLAVRYFSNLTWVLLEIRIPRDIQKTPEAMEQIFAGLQTMYWGFDPWETYWLGLQHDYIVFEIASMGGETRFYIRTPAFFKNVVEAQIYAQYPESEIVEVEDYMSALPDQVPSEEWDIFGVEFSLEKEDAYPIRTYRDFLTLEAGPKEFEKVDPFSSLAELFGKIGPGAHLGYHLLLRPAQSPTPDAWRKAGEALVAKLIGKKVAPKKNKIADALEPLEPLTKGWGEPLRPLFGLGEGESAAPKNKMEEKGDASLMMHLSPGTKDVVAAIEKNINKPGFEVIVRMCYVAKRDIFSMSHVSSFVGALKTYNTQTLNAFKLNSKTIATKMKWWLPSFVTAKGKVQKKSMYYQYYRSRSPFIGTVILQSKFIVLNTEELATIYHFPGMTAKAPLMPRIEAKRSEPPTALPVG